MTTQLYISLQGDDRILHFAFDEESGALERLRQIWGLDYLA